MKKVLVTGCAGFIGSSLVEKLLQMGYEVTGIDCFTNNYSSWIKKNNMKILKSYPNFKGMEANLLNLDLDQLLKDKHYVFHQAAIPGVRASWGDNFKMYMDHNVLATQRLLEAVKKSMIEKLIYASSSSIYGNTIGMTDEDTLPQPISPYGVSKLAGEQLSKLYYKNYGIPVVSLRYFTVFGPRQRPDMAIHKFLKYGMEGKEIPIYGDGKQSRDFTYIEDAIQANILALEKGRNGEAYNIGGKTKVQLLDIIYMISDLLGKKLSLSFIEEQHGDPKHTWADITKAQKELNYNPNYSIDKGIKKQLDYVSSLYLPKGGMYS